MAYQNLPSKVLRALREEKAVGKQWEKITLRSQAVEALNGSFLILQRLCQRVVRLIREMFVQENSVVKTY